MSERNKRVEPGGGDVFVVQVQFRQNATWQGTVKWAGESQGKQFRSTLELLKIMDGVLVEKHPEDKERQDE